MTQNTNQFAQGQVKGQLDLQINDSRVISGQISADETGALVVGDAVILDSNNTGPLPKFLLAGEDDTAIGHIVRSVKALTLAAGDAVEVAYNGGPVIWEEAGEALEPGDEVEMSTTQMVKVTTHSQRGIALDPASASGVLFRMIILPVAKAA